VEAKLSDDSVPKSADDVKRRERYDLLARLRDVTRQRDELLSQYEAMAFQVDESTKDVDGALLEARANAKRAQDCEVLEQREASQIKELTDQLEAERRKSGEIAAEFARYRQDVAQKLAEHAQREDPWSLLVLAVSQILSQAVAWLRAKIPADSALLPWFDRLADLLEATGQLAFRWSKAAFDWAKPRVLDLWAQLKAEIAKRKSKDERV
jgi:hypothetical protein